MKHSFKTICLCSLIAVLAFAGGCKSFGACGCHARAVMEASYTGTSVTIDGKLDEEVWKRAKVYPLQMSRDKIAQGLEFQEPGYVRLAWDSNFLYIGLELTDSDIVAEGTADNLQHYNLGDVGEVFLKPVDETWYWELYVTPAGRNSTFWFPGRGRLGLPSCFEAHHFNLKVAAQCDGTLNDWHDRDREWTAEMAVPLSELTARGEKFGPGSRWRILVARYNYTRYSKYTGPELSMVPQLSQTNYHLVDEYADLIFSK
jgi:hypothetical protein